MSQNTADQAMVRELNLSLVLRLIHNEAPISRAKIAQTTGLNKSTVSSLAEFLLKNKLIHETGIGSTGTGRPARLLEVNAFAGGIIGVEFGVDHIAVALSDFSGEILWSKNKRTGMQDEKEETLAQTLSLVHEAISLAKKKNLEVLGLGIATPGTVDVDEGLLIFAPNLQWHDVPLRDLFYEHTSLNVFVENDANAAAMAESLFGVARESENFILIFAGVGIGSGLFLNGDLYRGNIGYAGEIGHSPITAEPFEAPCHCGNRGCWETYANQHAIIRRVQSRLDARRKSIIPKLMKEKSAPLSIALIKEAADKADTEAIEALQETGAAMGLGIATLVSVLNPEKVILGGPLSIVGNYLLPSIKEVVNKRSLPELRPGIEIQLSAFEKDASLIGAVSIVVDNIFSNPTGYKRR
ncbi:MAG: ROK family transcriptional regulator [Anaerolineae bacterium]|jgi:glucokinase-like ROK family protein|nr:ROK family transcriptional regulator [Anaerolineae bacterium]